MNQYKITNRVSGTSETMNHEQICNRIITCKGNFSDIYSKEYISPTPIQDKFNVNRFSILDVLWGLNTMLALSILSYLLIKSII